MKPFLLISTRPEDSIAEEELDTFLRFTGLEPDQLRQLRLDQADFTCGGQSLVMDTSALNNAPGVPGEVTATIECSVPLADLAVPGVPGSWTLTAEAASPVDTYRERR